MKFFGNIIFAAVVFFAYASFAAPLLALAPQQESSVPAQADQITSQHGAAVVSPHITSPQQVDFWPTGSHQIVRWDTDKLPRDKIVADGLVVLGYLLEGSDDEHLDLEHPLASGFSLADGAVKVVIPANVDSRRDYFIVLFGNSGNVSPNFTIDQL